MRPLVERHRHLSLLVGMVLGELFFLPSKIKGGTDVRLIRLWAIAVVAPVEKVAVGVLDGLGSLWDNYIALYGARQENERLQAELAQARLRLQELEARAAEAGQLAALLELKQAHPRAPLVAAQVIGSSPPPTTPTVLLNPRSDARPPP